jgi:hypothetical protein
MQLGLLLAVCRMGPLPEQTGKTEMSKKAAIVAFVVLAFSAALPAQASLIGSSFTYTNVAGPYLDGTFLVGPGIEQSYCYYADSGSGSCLLGLYIDVGADTITTHGFNFLPPPNGYNSIANFVSFAFTGVNIASVDVLSNTFPGTNFAVSLADNVISWTHDAWFWAPQSQYTVVLGVKTVPEPGTLSLLAAGLVGLAAIRRRRAVA